MRDELCKALVARSVTDRMVFLTGDLGFMALEPLQRAMGSRFINAGVAEQNMVSVAAAMARQGLEVWTYSIAPFMYARPFEQIRNDIAFHGLPVKLIGNGGGYAYGVMGPTHHAIEDWGVLLTLPGMSVLAPVFDEDVAEAVERAGRAAGPCYLRLGRDEAPGDYAPPSLAPWRQLTHGDGPPVVVAGPLAGTYIRPFMELPFARRPKLWAVAQLPIEASGPPPEFLHQLGGARSLVIAEEHVARGGLASELVLHLNAAGIRLPAVKHLHARAHVFERYGSQAWLRKQSGLDPASVLEVVADA